MMLIFPILIVLQNVVQTFAQFALPPKIGQEGLGFIVRDRETYRKGPPQPDEYYMKLAAKKIGDKVYAKNGNQKECNAKKQTRIAGAFRLEKLLRKTNEHLKKRCKPESLLFTDPELEEEVEDSLITSLAGKNTIRNSLLGLVPSRIGRKKRQIQLDKVVEDSLITSLAGKNTIRNSLLGLIPSRIGRKMRQIPEWGICGKSAWDSHCDKGNIRVESIFYTTMKGEYRLVLANGIPDHCYMANQTKTVGKNACEFFRYIYDKPMTFKRRKDIDYSPTRVGPVGIAVSGAYLYNHMAPNRGCNVAAILEKEFFDPCDGHTDSICRYHYHKAPICIDGWNRCGLIGYMMDALPIYGVCSLKIKGKPTRLRSCYRVFPNKAGCSTDNYEFRPGPDCNLDKANGYYFEEDTETINPDISFKKGDYAYFITPEYPFVMPYQVGRGNLCMLTFEDE